MIHDTQSSQHNTMVCANAISHCFETLLYENLCLDVKSGECVAILGVSGSGKSTILNNLSTLLPPKKGSVSLLGINNIYALSDKELLSLRRLDIGIVFQAHYLFRGMSGIENLKVASILSQKPIDDTLLESFGIKHIIHQNIGELSGGQQQRLSIARVLTKKPKIIFADEPTGNLDKDTALRVMSVMFQYIRKKNGALLLATHDEEIANLCNRVYHLYDKTLHLVSEK